jgi:hypothetical protein
MDRSGRRALPTPATAGGRPGSAVRMRQVRDQRKNFAVQCAGFTPYGQARQAQRRCGVGECLQRMGHWKLLCEQRRRKGSPVQAADGLQHPVKVGRAERERIHPGQICMGSIVGREVCGCATRKQLARRELTLFERPSDLRIKMFPTGIILIGTISYILVLTNLFFCVGVNTT